MRLLVAAGVALVATMLKRIFSRLCVSCALSIFVCMCSGVPLDRAAYMASVEFWQKHALVQ